MADVALVGPHGMARKVGHAMGQTSNLLRFMVHFFYSTSCIFQKNDVAKILDPLRPIRFLKI
jgi:hypothetical protein